MHLFYLNECLGSASYGIDDLSVGLVTVVQAFNKLANVPKLKIEKGWVIEKNPSEMYLGGVKLQDIVNKMRDKESKRLFFIYCTNYPIHTFFPQVDDDELLEADYRLDGADALNIALAVNNNGILLTLPVAECLKQNTIVINSNHDGVKSLSALNLHGSSEDNVVFISRKILDRNYSAGDGLDKLANLALEVYFSDYFISRFNKLTNNDKKSIFDRLDEAREGHLIQPLSCNGTVIKRVGKHVVELRIVNPVDIRVYFHEDGNKLFFARLAFKSEYGENDQDEDIQKSEEMIIGMLKAKECGALSEREG